MNLFKLLLVFLSVFIIGCSVKQSKNNPEVNAININRTFEDLILGMSIGEFQSKLIYVGPADNGGSKDYIVYSSDSTAGTLKSGMKKIENVYSVTCFFFEDKLWGISIEYANSYTPSWANFIANSKQKYGNGLLTNGAISWNDGKTLLSITTNMGVQSNEYGTHYVVNYSDDELVRKLDDWEKEQSPKL
jgi:hypothetical protein